MKTIHTLVVGAALVGLAGHAAAQANLVTNGSFESQTVNSPFINITKADQGLTGWLVGVNSVDLVGSLWSASHGANSVDLDGTKKGEIHQTIQTVVGQTYQLSFDLAGNFQGGPALKEMTVNVGSFGAYSFDTTGKTATQMGWTHYSTSFVAVSTATTLSFASGTSGSYGVALDNVAVTAVPEPESFAMLLAGLGMMGMIARRRKVTETR